MIMDNRNLRLLVFLAIVVSPMSLMAQEDGEKIPGGEIRTLHSSVLEEDRTLYVGLPGDYDATDTDYAVFYKLDGDERSFAMTLSELEELREAKLIPPMILVGIPNTDRDRDMLPVAIPGRRGSGGSDNFLKFVQEEMIPFVEENYRASDFNIIMGTSNTALFAIYAFVHQPSTFDAYLASSPMIGHSPELIQTATERLLSQDLRLDASLYIIYGDEDSSKVVESVPVFLKQLRASMPEGLRLEHVILPGEGHVPSSSLTRGMGWIYSDLEPR
jgi:predicted alpha/beta superfamily hydrolase